MKAHRSPSPVATRRAKEVHRELRIACIEEIDPELIAAHYGAITRYRPLRHEEGHLIQSLRKGVITINERWLEHPRAKWLVAHELGHFLLHPQVDQYRACTLGDLHDYRSSGREPEANLFAAEFLMPERMFKDECDRNRPCLDDVLELADRYGTSLLSTAIRFTKFSPERCAAVVSRDRRVAWASRSADWRYFIPKDQLLTTATYAGDLHAGRDIPSRPQRVEARAWSDATWIGDQDVFEHTMLLGGTGIVLTMLWEPSE